jgi:hypothetical protein
MPIGHIFATIVLDTHSGSISGIQLSYIVSDPKYFTPTEPSGAAAALVLRVAMGLLRPDQGETDSPSSEVMERYSNRDAVMHRGEAKRAGDEDQELADAKA